MTHTISRGRFPQHGLASIHEPLLIFGAPRSGTSMLFQALSTHTELWSLYRESQEVVEKSMAAVLAARNSDELRSADLQPADIEAISGTFYNRVGNAEALGGLSSKLPLILRAKLNRVLTSDYKGSKRQRFVSSRRTHRVVSGWTSWSESFPMPGFCLLLEIRLPT